MIFHPTTQTFGWALFVQSIKGMSYKNTETLYFVTLNSDAKFEKTLTLWYQEGHEDLGERSLEHSNV